MSGWWRRAEVCLLQGFAPALVGQDMFSAAWLRTEWQMVCSSWSSSESYLGVGKESISDTSFPFQPQRLRGRRCSCVLCATRCSSSDCTSPSQLLGPALPDAWAAWFPAGITLPEAAWAHSSSCLYQLGADQPYLLRSMCCTSCVSAAEGLYPIPMTAPWQLLQALALSAPLHVLVRPCGLAQ